MLQEIVGELSPADLKVLRVLDLMLNRYSYVPLEIIEKRSRLSPKQLMRVVARLTELKAIVKGGANNRGYRITYLGLDLLALYSLTHKGLVAYIGPLLGVGKESEVYSAKLSDGVDALIKFYRIGRISFQKVVRFRGYLVDKTDWLIRSKIAAEREFKALQMLHHYTSYVPKVYGWNRHAVVMARIEGIELYKCRELPEPDMLLKRILSVVREAYLKVGIVHGDLSEYNILVSRDLRTPYIIDWPQYLYRDDPAHFKILERDVNQLIKFFKRRYKVVLSLERALKYVKGEVDEV